MRKIKFRGKRKDGKWTYGCLFIYKDGDRYLINESRDLIISGWVEVIPETVGQYIGLKDMYGKETFGGDIIELYYPNGKIFSEVPVAYIFYKKGAWRVSGFDKFPYLSNILSNLELKFKVIGNVYDNPELLEKG